MVQVLLAMIGILLILLGGFGFHAGRANLAAIGAGILAAAYFWPAFVAVGS
jgi:hypothetical protein